MGLSESDILSLKNHKWLEVIVQFLSGFRNDTADFSRPHVRASLSSLYPLLVLLYALLVVLGLLVNNALLGAVVYGRHHLRDLRPSGGLLANLAAAHIAQCACVLPMSLAVLLVQNWVFGKFLCYVIPMVQVRGTNEWSWEVKSSRVSSAHWRDRPSSHVFYYVDCRLESSTSYFSFSRYEHGENCVKYVY